MEIVNIWDIKVVIWLVGLICQNEWTLSNILDIKIMIWF